MILNEMLNDVGDIIFPSQCLGCAELLHPFNGNFFCPTCQEKIKFINGNLCPICGISFSSSPAQSHLCGNCLENEPYFSCARAVASYETLILKAIHQFKYNRNILNGATLGSFMANFSFPDFDFSEYSLLIPVPLHIKKLRERGFNQSLILAHAIEKKQQIPVNFFLLKRPKFTLTQTGLNRTERKKNVKGAFAVSDKKIIAGKNVILIDDVYTTGATINECAKTLIKAGAQKVAVLTLARVLHS